MPPSTQHAAMLLEVLDAETAEAILSHLPDEQAAQIRRFQEGAGKRGTSTRDIERMLSRFDRDYRFVQTIGGGKPQLRVVGAEPTEEETPPFEPSGDALKDVKRLKPQMLASGLKEEHPRMIALLLQCFDIEHTVQVLSFLEDEQQRAVVVELGRQTSTRTEVVEQVAEVVVQRVAAITHARFPQTDPIDRTAAVLRNFSGRQRRDLMTALTQQAAGVAEQVSERLYQFDDLKQLSSRAMQKLLGETETKILAVAMQGVDDETREKVEAGLSKRAAMALKEESELIRASEEEIEAARKRVIAIFARLDQSGDLR